MYFTENKDFFVLCLLSMFGEIFPEHSIFLFMFTLVKCIGFSSLKSQFLQGWGNLRPL